MTYAGPKVVRAYEAVLADVRAGAEAGDEPGAFHQDWLARIGLEMYYQDGQRQIQQILKPNAESQQQLAQAIASFEKAWALRTLAPADQQYLFPKALYGWAHALEDRAWIEQDARGMPHAQYAQAAKVKYQEFIAEARQYQDKKDYPHRAHLYHAESQQAHPLQRGSLKALAWRTLSLTGSFETGADEPHNFAGLAGNFDGQGLSFGAIQWNIGQQTLPELLIEINRQQAAVVQSAFGPRYDALHEMLSKTRTLQLNWATIATKKAIPKITAVIRVLRKTRFCIIS
jgi:hypothetical protein